MNGINRRSQKVICIAEFDLIDAASGRLYSGPTPQINEVYTVDAFVDSGPLVDTDGILTDGSHDAPGITLVELKSPKTKSKYGGRRPLGWPIVGFRPLLERGTDISALVAGYSVRFVESMADSPQTDVCPRLIVRRRRNTLRYGAKSYPL
jgi:hypothetical protein